MLKSVVFIPEARRYDPLMFSAGEQYCMLRRVNFADTDMSGRAHFTALLRYVEEAEHEWLRGKGIAVGSKNGDWPRVHVDCDYRAPIAFGDEIEVSLVVGGMGRTSVRYDFALKNNGVVCAEGSMVIVRAGGLAVVDAAE